MGTASALCGPATSPVVVSAMNQIINQLTDNLTNKNPVQNKKGSVNQGGGGGGGGSGCGKSASPEQCEEKAGGCGGGGGGCGGGKKANPDEIPFIVAFIDYQANPIMTDVNGMPIGIGPIQEVKKNETCTRPWLDNNEAMRHPQGFIPGLKFTKWSEDDAALNAVQKDLVVIPIYDIMTQQDLLNVQQQYLDMGLDIQDFISESIQQYNDTLDQCISDINTSTEVICGPTSRSRSTIYKGIMKAIAENISSIDEESKSKCYDISKCILNVQSCYIFQMRMLFNDECNFIKSSNSIGFLGENEIYELDVLYDKERKEGENEELDKFPIFGELIL
jgi:hypothetical protein